MFCKCGCLISYPKEVDDQLICKRCFNKLTYTDNIIYEESVFTHNNTIEKNNRNEGIINEICPNCNHNQLSYTTLQLRSADEGQTVFYTCLNCKHKFTINS
ncbi:RPA12 [Hepatospora eriocheir]|uniref:DNA-directed RNA polymerase subunit n=1 Tax=Hepatospora eriocheir TaxID=1081669 RepID=A0A1X0QAE2_9MICR|nr:RPA12 [Hepatospora eriocheir]